MRGGRGSGGGRRGGEGLHGSIIHLSIITGTSPTNQQFPREKRVPILSLCDTHGHWSTLCSVEGRQHQPSSPCKVVVSNVDTNVITRPIPAYLELAS